ncbi:MAG: type II toxin-antitoxin system HicB family antitoxin [Actinomycetes bacterium]
MEAIVQILAAYLKEHHRERSAVSINDAFQQRFHVPLPDELNDSHELPGRAADGATYAQAPANAEVVIHEWIETARELGRPIPRPKDRLLFA